MRAVVQRVSRASVRVDGATAGEIADGLCVLLSVGVDDSEDDAVAMADKIAGLRIFADDAGLMNRDVAETSGRVLLISQFTLHGDARKGRRPSFITAAREEAAKPLYERVGQLLERERIPVAYGIFGARMSVELINEGPVTILLDTKKLF
ncbi:MAG: D-tyrosyl-tRNA(Tyr) deacylase [Candidatus Eremiobacteraeota bacterium]|nr:D-tyrosyl-tRNA(Tyr) deacylase [Candidatus Eremiobacteraeota bacterium]